MRSIPAASLFWLYLPSDGAVYRSRRECSSRNRNWSTILTFSRVWRQFGLQPIVCAATWSVMIRSLMTKRLTSLACISNHRCTPLYSVSTRRIPSKRWIAWTGFALSPGRAERHGFEYYRHGALSLYGALNCIGSAACSPRLLVLRTRKLKLRSAKPSESQKSRSRFR